MYVAAVILLACLLGSLGGRAQLTVTMLVRAHGRSAALSLVAIGSALLTTTIWASAGTAIAAQLPEAMQVWIAVIALFVAAIELLIPVVPPQAKEPTRSFGAIALALIAKQMFDAPRLIVFAATIQAKDWTLVGLAAAIGSSLAILSEFLLPGSTLSSRANRTLRLVLMLACLAVTMYAVTTYSGAISAG